MLFDVTQTLYDLHGEVLLEDDDKTPLTARKILEVALITRGQRESLSAEEQVERFTLALRVATEDQLDLTSEEVVKLKKWVAARSAPLVTGQMALLLEGKKGLGPDEP